MNRKTWSIILLCLTILSFIATVAVFIGTEISFQQLQNAEIDTSNDNIPGASLLGVAVASIGLWIGLIFFGGIFASIGFLCSLIGTKITQKIVLNRISKAFLYFFSVELIFILVLSLEIVFKF